MKRSPYLLRSNRLYLSKNIAKSFKKSILKGRRELRSRKLRQKQKVPKHRLVYSDIQALKTNDLAIVVRIEPKNVHDCSKLNENSDFDGPGFKFAAKGTGNWSVFNFQDEYDASESTYQCSDFKPTPVLVSPKKPAAYFLRSSVVTNNRIETEIPNQQKENINEKLQK